MAWMMLASAAAAVTGSIIEGQAQGAAHDANARIADQNRDIALEQGNAREEQVRRRAAMILGAQYGATAESGVDPNRGSAARAIAQSAANAELDALSTRYEGQMQGFGFGRERDLERQRGHQARVMGHVNGVLAAARILGGGSQSGSYGSTSWGGTAATFGPGSGFGDWTA